MRITTGTVISGKVVIRGPAIADGTDVYVLTREVGETSDLSSEELADLEAGIAEADQGDLISGATFFQHLRRHE